MFITFIVLLVLAEVALRVITSFAIIYDIEMIKYAHHLKKPSSIPGLSHQHIPNSKAHLMGHDVTLNSLGHRSPELVNPKSNQEKRIHFIGDSCTMGWGVPQNGTTSAVTRDLLNQTIGAKTGKHFVDINAGVGNYNAVFTSKLFEQQVNQVSPDLVVFKFYINDAEPDPQKWDNFIFRHSVLAAFMYLKYRSIWVIRNETLPEYYAKTFRPGTETRTQANLALQNIKKICDLRGMPMVGLLVPEMHDLSKEGPYPPIYAIITQMFSDLGIPLINPLDELRATFGDRSTKPWVAEDDPHPSAEAHAVMARKLSHYLATLPW
ncbi:MAG: SGNH/GDSL hydrolase family protein [Magnetococcus sp. YQC-5]